MKQAASQSFWTDRFACLAHQAIMALSITALTVQPILAQSVPIVADPNAQGGLAIQTAPNGVPLVDIATPNAQGLSHNTYSQFSVGAPGTILNNETGTFGTTQLAGLVQGNPNLAGSGAARVILNEVVSTNRSELGGIVEVAGQSADVIIANPNGITCNGCGFIRTPRVVLTTGTPEIEGEAMTGFRVTGGDIRFGANGADLGTVSLFDVVSRQITFEGTVQGGDDVRLAAGPNRSDYATGTVSLLPGDHGAGPAYAIDSTAFGGLQAGRIGLLATEQGVGVRAPTEMAAHSGQMTLTADGRLVLGRAQAQGPVIVRSDTAAVEIETALFSDGAITLTGQSAVLSNSATMAAGGDVTLEVADTVTLGDGALLASGMTGFDGTLQGDGALSVTAARLLASDARLAAAGTAEITADTVALDQSTAREALTVLGSTTLTTDRVTAMGATLTLGGDLTLNSDTALALTGGSYSVGGDLDVAAESLTSSSGIAMGGGAELETRSGNMVLSGDLEADGAVTLNSAGDLTLTARLASGETATLTSAGAFSASDTIVAKGDLRVTGASILNSGALGTSDGDLTLKSLGDITNSGLFYAGQDILLALDGTLENTTADIIAEGGITIRGHTGPQAAAVRNRSANIEAITGSLMIAAAYVANEQPIPTITDKVTVTTRAGTAADFPGISHPPGTYRVVETITTTRQVADAATDAPSRVRAGGNVQIDAETILNQYSQISANGDVTLNATNITNTGQDLTETVVTTVVSYYAQRYCKTRIFGFCVNRGTRYLQRTNTSTATSTIGAVFASIQAGGTLNATATGYLQNDAVRSGVAQIGLSSGTRSLGAPGATGAGDPNIILGRPALFVPTGNPDAPFLIETRPEFIDVSRFLSSDYFLGQIGGYDADLTMRRFGDAYVEARLIQEQLFALTGRPFGADPGELRRMMRDLYDNALEAAEALQLTPGVALSPAQIASLTETIIWLETRVIDGESVLVPVVYLAGADVDERSLASARIAAADVVIQAGSALNSGRIAGGESVEITTEGDLLNIGGQIASEGNVELEVDGRLANVSGEISGDDVTIEAGGLENSLAVIRDETPNGFADRVQDEAVITATGELEITVEGDIAAEGGQFTAGNDATLEAGGDIAIGAATVETRREDTFAEGFDRGYELENELAGVTAGGDIVLDAGEDLTIAGAEISARGDVTLSAEGDVRISSVQEIRQEEYRFEIDTGGLFGTETSISDQERVVTTTDTTITAGGVLSVTSETGGLTLSAPELESGGQTTLSAEVGDVALLTTEDSAFERYERYEEDLFWWNSEDRGFSEITRTPTRITSEGGLQIIAGERIIAEYVPTGGDFEAGIAQLAAAPGLEWMGQLQEMDNVAWREARTAFEEWNYEEQGLTEAGALLVTVVTSYALGPGIDTLATNLTSQIGGGAALEAALHAGLTGLSNQAAISLINNQGDLGAVLEELGSSDSLRGLVTAMVSAGLTTRLTDAFGVGPELAPNTPLADRIAHHLQTELLSASVDAAVSSAINGEDFGDALAANLRGAASAVLGAVVAENIGAAAAQGDIDRAAQLIAHAVLGCAAGGIGSGDCSSGAVGAFAGELTVLLYSDAALANPDLVGESVERWQEAGISLSRLAGGLAAAMAGGSANAGADAAENAAENNAFWIPVLLVAAYLTYEGEGNPVEGLITVGRGEDVASRLLGAGAEQAISFASAHFPEETVWILDAAATAGEAANVVVTYVDDATGNRVSTTWNRLPPDVRDAIKGGTTIASILIPAGTAAKVGRVIPDKIRNAPLVPVVVSGRVLLKVGDKTVGHIDEATGTFTRALGVDSPVSESAVNDAIAQVLGPGAVGRIEVPPKGAPYVRFAGKEIELSELGDIRVKFDELGYPILNPFARYDIRFTSAEFLKKHSDTQMREATSNLFEELKRNPNLEKLFDEDQLKAIARGGPRIPGLTWHHHQETGRMQLVDREIHEKVPHIGGSAMWRKILEQSENERPQ